MAQYAMPPAVQYAKAQYDKVVGPTVTPGAPGGFPFSTYGQPTGAQMAMPSMQPAVPLAAQPVVAPVGQAPQMAPSMRTLAVEAVKA